MAELSLEQARENIYRSLAEDNRDLDQHIAALKTVLAREGLGQAVFEPKRLVQNNRQGRKTMQAYFRQRGVAVAFAS